MEIEPEPPPPPPKRPAGVVPPDEWASWPDEKLLDLRISQLGVTIEGSVLESRIAAVRLAERLPGIRLADHGEPEWHDSLVLRGVKHLPVAL